MYICMYVCIYTSLSVEVPDTKPHFVDHQLYANIESDSSVALCKYRTTGEEIRYTRSASAPRLLITTSKYQVRKYHF